MAFDRSLRDIREHPDKAYAWARVMCDTMAYSAKYPEAPRRKLYWRNPVGCTQPNIKACLRGCVGSCEAREEAEEIKRRVKV